MNKTIVFKDSYLLLPLSLREHPILQRRIKTPNGLRTVAGLGSWSGWIYSAEMDNAIKLGYHFEIINSNGKN